MIQINLIDDYRADIKPVQSASTYSQSSVTFMLTDEYLANSLDPSNLYVQYSPSIYDNIVFVVNIEDDYAKANDEYVLITEEGLVISLEDYHNQDEIAIIVR